MPGFGQNGSVAWVVVGKHGGKNVLSPRADGLRGKIDDPPVKDFLVRLRFEDADAANAAWANREQTLANGEFVVILKVPAQPPDPNRTHLESRRQQRAQREPALGNRHRLGFLTRA